MTDEYFSEVKNYKLLTTEEEKTISKKAKYDNKYRELLINSNLRLAIKNAKKYTKYADLDDLIQQGNIGLIKAFEKYDPERNCKFSTYATYWIKKEIIDHLYQDKLVKVPRYFHRAYEKIIKTIKENLINNSEKLTIEKIAELINEKKFTAKYIKKIIKLNRTKFADIDEKYLEAEESEFDEYNTISKIIKKEITTLSVDELTKKILNDRLFEHEKYKEIAAKYCLNEKWSCQKYRIGITALKYKLLKHKEFKTLI